MQKAAAHIPVFTRPIDVSDKMPVPTVDPGHFKCACSAGQLSTSRFYNTFYLYQNMGEEDDYGEIEKRFLCSFVVSFQDSYFADKLQKSLWQNIAHPSATFGNCWDTWLSWSDLLQDSNIYMRIFYDGIEERHVNNKFDLAAYLLDIGDVDHVVAWHVPSFGSTGVYPDPQMKGFNYDISSFKARNIDYLEAMAHEVGVSISNRLELTRVKPLTPKIPVPPMKKVFSWQTHPVTPVNANDLAAMWKDVVTANDPSWASFAGLVEGASATVSEGAEPDANPSS